MDPTAFIRIEDLRTLPGQLMAVLLLTQVVKSAWPSIPTYSLRASCMVLAMGLHALMTMGTALSIEGGVLSLLNGAVVGLATLRTAEAIKGEWKPAPPTVATGSESFEVKS